jgi:hypothetical protein
MDTMSIHSILFVILSAITQYRPGVRVFVSMCVALCLSVKPKEGRGKIGLTVPRKPENTSGEAPHAGATRFLQFDFRYTSINGHLVDCVGLRKEALRVL